MSAADIFFPKSCLRCKKPGRYICKGCVGEVRFAKPICPMCGKAAIDGMTHVICKKPFGMDGLICLWDYKGVIKNSILKLKYSFAYNIASELSFAMSYFLKRLDRPLLDKALLIPVPLHKKRQNWRGFNQSGEIGKIVAREMGWEYLDTILIRKRKMLPQTMVKDKEDRLKNAIGIFGIDKRYSKRLSTDCPLLVFDDVWTTGATIREAAKVLKRNGAKSVWGMTLAH